MGGKNLEDLQTIHQVLWGATVVLWEGWDPNAPDFFLAEEQLALSNRFDMIPIETINSKCNVLTKQIYDALKKPNKDDYYYRFDYAHNTQKFKEIMVRV